jgi:ATP-dependent Clp protease ATP-binding subunit ClpA
MLSKELEFTLNLAFKEAREKNHEFMTVEHLLFALLGNPSAVEVLRACGGNLDLLKQELGTFLEETTPKLSAEDTRETQPTLGLCFMYSLPTKRRSPAPMCWWQSSASRSHRRFIFSTS